MAFSKIRRPVIVVVGFLLVVNLALLVLARVGSTRASAGPTAFDVVAWADKTGTAESLKAKLEAVGEAPSVQETSRDVQVLVGFHLVMEGDPDFLKPVKATLEFKKRLVKLIEDGRVLQLGGVFTDKAKAEARAREIAQADKMTFNVREAFKTEQQSAFEIRVPAVPAERVEEVRDLLQGNVLEIVVTPVAEGGKAGQE